MGVTQEKKVIKVIKIGATKGVNNGKGKQTKKGPNISTMCTNSLHSKLGKK